jgi:hypothetical protein
MSIALEKSFGLLQPDRPFPAARDAASDAGIDALAAWMDPRHTLLLRTLLEGANTAPALPGSPATLGRISEVLDDLRRDTRLKFAEFRDKWTPRLETAALIPFLRRNQWFVPHPQGGIALVGKGSRKEAKMLYLQILHDMVSDCARQWSGLAGRLQVFQTAFAADWHREAVKDNETRMLPVLEAALRSAEFDAWKSFRLGLGDIAEEAFTRAVGRWEGRRFADPETLVRDLAAPWRDLDGAQNGFIGFMRALSRLAERLSLGMLDHYDRKWELFLRGFAADL